MIADSGSVSLGVIVIVFVLYWAPTVVAFVRDHHQKGSILVINLLLGWTFIGWVVALAMSVSRVRSDPV